LAEYFLDEFCSRNNFRRKTVDEEVLTILERYAWPGNARELKNVVERMAILSTTDRISAAAVPVEIRLIPDADSRSNLQQMKESAERESILKALEQTSWNVAAAARSLGIERTNLHKRIRALGIIRGEG
jgi:two-component system nitrogen regulation response regulator NtrX